MAATAVTAAVPAAGALSSPEGSVLEGRRAAGGAAGLDADVVLDAARDGGDDAEDAGDGRRQGTVALGTLGMRRPMRRAAAGMTAMRYSAAGD